ncbi:MAG: hypothetical protein WDN45_06025 [Caulobacteraceae bacterium]
MTSPALARLDSAWLKPPRSRTPAAATIVAEAGLNLFGPPARRVPAVTTVAPL